MPIVVGKAASSRCFKDLRDKKNPLGVPYYSNAKAWMNSDIMFDVLTKTNRKLAQQKRNVVLFLDNVSSHPPGFSKKFSHTYQSDLSSKEHNFTPSAIGRRYHQELQS